MKKWRQAVAAVAAVLAASALVRELRQPSSQRSWHGRIAGVPYDFRPPTLERVRQRWWNPDDPRLLTDRVFGLGWAINLARLAGRSRSRSSG